MPSSSIHFRSFPSFPLCHALLCEGGSGGIGGAVTQLLFCGLVMTICDLEVYPVVCQVGGPFLLDFFVFG